MLNLVAARSYFVFLHFVISEEALGEILLFLFIDLEFNLTAFLDLNFLLLNSWNKEVFILCLKKERRPLSSSRTLVRRSSRFENL